MINAYTLTSHVTSLLVSGATQPEALVAGFHRGLLLTAVLSAANLVLALTSKQMVPDAEQMAELAAA